MNTLTTEQIREIIDDVGCGNIVELGQSGGANCGDKWGSSPIICDSCRAKKPLCREILELRERVEELESRPKRNGKSNLSPPPTSDTVRGGGWRR